MLFTKSNSWILDQLSSSMACKTPKYCYVQDIINLKKGKLLITDGKHFIQSTFIHDSYLRMMKGYREESVILKGSVLMLQKYFFAASSKYKIELAIEECIYMGDGSLMGETKDISTCNLEKFSFWPKMEKNVQPLQQNIVLNFLNLNNGLNNIEEPNDCKITNEPRLNTQTNLISMSFINNISNNEEKPICASESFLESFDLIDLNTDSNINIKKLCSLSLNSQKSKSTCFADKTNIQAKPVKSDIKLPQRKFIIDTNESIEEEEIPMKKILGKDIKAGYKYVAEEENPKTRVLRKDIKAGYKYISEDENPKSRVLRKDIKIDFEFTSEIEYYIKKIKAGRIYRLPIIKAGMPKIISNNKDERTVLMPFPRSFIFNDDIIYKISYIKHGQKLYSKNINLRPIALIQTKHMDIKHENNNQPASQSLSFDLASTLNEKNSQMINNPHKTTHITSLPVSFEFEELFVSQGSTSISQYDFKSDPVYSSQAITYSPFIADFGFLESETCELIEPHIDFNTYDYEA